MNKTSTLCAHCGESTSKQICEHCGIDQSCTQIIKFEDVDYKKRSEIFLNLWQQEGDWREKSESENHSLRHLIWATHICDGTNKGTIPYMECNNATDHEPIDFISDSYQSIFDKLILKKKQA